MNDTATIEAGTDDREARGTARRTFATAHSAWTAAVAEIAALNASPDDDDQEAEAAFDAAISAAYVKRRAAIALMMNAPAQRASQLLQKFAVIEDVAFDQSHTMPGSDNPLLALIASLKADVLRLDLWDGSLD